jgi:hypothetical protein
MDLNRSDDTGDSGFLRNGRFSHAYIVWGGSDADRSDLAGMLAAAQVCAGTGRKPAKRAPHCDKLFVIYIPISSP